MASESREFRLQAFHFFKILDESQNTNSFQDNLKTWFAPELPMDFDPWTIPGNCTSGPANFTNFSLDFYSDFKVTKVTEEAVFEAMHILYIYYMYIIYILYIYYIYIIYIIYALRMYIDNHVYIYIYLSIRMYEYTTLHLKIVKYFVFGFHQAWWLRSRVPLFVNFVIFFFMFARVFREITKTDVVFTNGII